MGHSPYHHTVRRLPDRDECSWRPERRLASQRTTLHLSAAFDKAQATCVESARHPCVQKMLRACRGSLLDRVLTWGTTIRRSLGAAPNAREVTARERLTVDGASLRRSGGR